jgi:xylulokinase
MKPEGYLGLDVGGTSAKAGVFDREGRLLGMAHRSYKPQVTDAGHVEIPVDTIYSAAREAAVTAIDISGARILALSISSQGQTFVSLNELDESLHPAIAWYDARALEQADRLAQALQCHPKVESRPAIDAISTAPKIMWLRDRNPALMEQASRYLLVPDYFAYRLTGRAVTDPWTASTTGLYADDAPDYCAQALAAAGIERCEVAEIADSGRPIGRVLKERVAEWGLDPQTLMVTGSNDQCAGALGAGVCRPGIVSAAAGTCLALVTLTPQLPHPLPMGLWGGRFPIREYQYGLTFAKTAGVVLDWFKREFAEGRSLQELDAMAAQVPPGSRGVMALPHFDGMISPVPNASARGGFLNLSLHHTRADLYRAALESLGYNLRENLDLFRRTGFTIESVRMIGGGARSDVWLQMIADITGLPVERPVNVEAALAGAAIMAAVGAGVYSSLEEGSESFHRIERVFVPDPGRRSVYEEFFVRYTQIFCSLYGPQM